MVKFVLGDGSVVSPDNAESEAQLRKMGIQEASPHDLKVDTLKQQYSSWLYAPEAAALGVAEGAFPGAMSGAIHGLAAVSPDAAATTADFVQGVVAGNPGSNAVGMGVGMLVSPVGKAAGWAKTALTGGIQAAAMSADSLAVEHIATPEGSEKIAATLGMAALFGGAFAVGGKALGKWVGGGAAQRGGEALEAKGAALKESGSVISNPGVQAKLEELGGQDSVAALADQYNLLDKSPKVIKNTLKEIQVAAQKTMNQVKDISTDALPALEQEEFAASVGPLLEDGAPDLARRVGEGTTVNDLHQLQVAISGRTNFQDLGNPYNARMKSAYDAIGEHIEKTLYANEGINGVAVGLVEQWQKAKEDFQAIKFLQQAMGSAEAEGSSVLARLGGKAQAIGSSAAAYGVIGGNPGAMAGGAATFALGSAAKAVSNPVVVGAGLEGLGKLLQKTDQYIVQTAVAGLSRTGGGQAVASAAGKHLAQLVTVSDYDTAAAGVQWANENPTRAVPRLAQEMERRGVPGRIIDSVVPQQIRNAQYLNSVKPKNPWIGKSVAPVAWAPSFKQKTAYVDQVNAVNNPVWALHNATPERVAAIKATYPILYQRFAAMVTEEAAQRPDLSLHARRWASSVTGMPSTPGSGQGPARLMYDAQRAQDAQMRQEQQAKRSGGPSATVDLNMGRTGRMSE